MNDKKSIELAQAWIDFQKNWWAWDKLDELCRKDDQAAWPVLLKLVELAGSEDLLEDIGVGPLEDFVNYYAADYIDQLESAAAQSEALKKALSFLQIRQDSHKFSDRLAALGCKVSRDKLSGEE